MKRQLEHKNYLNSNTYRIIYILAGYRRIAELTKEEFSKNVKVSASLISQIESGRKEVSNDTLRKMIETIAQQFGYDANVFATLLEEQAEKLNLNENQTHNNIVFVRCIHNITKKLLSNKR